MIFGKIGGNFVPITFGENLAQIICLEFIAMNCRNCVAEKSELFFLEHIRKVTKSSKL